MHNQTLITVRDVETSAGWYHIALSGPSEYPIRALDE